MVAMSYRQCPHCRANNRTTDTVCYSCQNSLEPPPTEPESTVEVSSGEVARQTGQAVLALALAVFFGGLLGLGWEHLPMELPFFLEELLLGIICATATAYVIGKFQDMPHWRLFPRLWPAALFGAVVGTCLYAIWWSFDPAVGGLGIGMWAGFCAGLPVVVSFGLAGGESRPLGKLEFTNFAVSLGVGALFALFIVVEDDPSLFPGFVGVCGLLPTLAGNRVNLWEMMEHFSSER